MMQVMSEWKNPIFVLRQQHLLKVWIASFVSTPQNNERNQCNALHRVSELASYGMQLYMCPFHYWLLAGVICGLKRVHARRARCDDKGRQNVANVLTLLSCSVLAFHDQMAKFE